MAATNKTQIREMLRDAAEVYLINAGKNQDGTEFLTIKLDGIPSL